MIVSSYPQEANISLLGEKLIEFTDNLDGSLRVIVHFLVCVSHILIVESLLHEAIVYPFGEYLTHVID